MARNPAREALTRAVNDAIARGEPVIVEQRAVSEIREYLEAKAAAREGEWLRRRPKTTHPLILAAVRESGALYNDDVERAVEAAAGDLPEHYYHGHEKRHRLTKQLGHEVYIARGILDDEAAQARADEHAAAGFVSLDEFEVREGGRYIVRFGTRYVGRSEPEYGEEKTVTARRNPATGRFVFLPKGARTRGFVPTGPALIKEAV